MSLVARLNAATASVTAPLAAVDLAAFESNAATLAGRAHGLPIRVATKSVRCRALLDAALAMPGFRGLMAYSVAEAHWLARHGHEDIVVAYPSVDAAALGGLARDESVAGRVTVMVDSVEYVDWLAGQVPDAAGLAIALDVDASLRLGPGGRVHLGVRRSPLVTVADVLAVVHRAGQRGLRVEGLMFYDAQIAGVPDTSPVVRAMKRRSHAALLRRRHEITQAVRAATAVRFVNGGGTGSLHLTGGDPVLTELAAGSGLYAPTLFDHYDAEAGPGLEPALFFATPVVRRPAPDVVTTFSGGYVASGPPGRSRVPQPLPEQRLRLLGTEGAGEVQTPLHGPGAAALRLGDKVWFRPAKAGEPLERFTEVHLVRESTVQGVAPTYRGEARSFG